MKYDRKNGFGQLNDTKTGEIYKGNFKDDEKHGPGELTTKDLQCKKQTWKNGVLIRWVKLK